jgi:hypothetical protein
MKKSYSVFLILFHIIFFSCNNNTNKNVSVIDLEIIKNNFNYRIQKVNNLIEQNDLKYYGNYQDSLRIIRISINDSELEEYYKNKFVAEIDSLNNLIDDKINENKKKLLNRTNCVEGKWITEKNSNYLGKYYITTWSEYTIKKEGKDYSIQETMHSIDEYNGNQHRTWNYFGEMSSSLKGDKWYIKLNGWNKNYLIVPIDFCDSPSKIYMICQPRHGYSGYLYRQ